RGRSVDSAEGRGDRVGVNAMSRFDRTPGKTARARRLRHDPTIVERRLWYRLRNGQIDGHRFRRQHPAGPYLPDFFWPQLHLAIELDGGQHSLAGGTSSDRRRDAWLAARGVTVLRFWNSDVVGNMSGVLEQIAIVAADLTCKDRLVGHRWKREERDSQRGH